MARYTTSLDDTGSVGIYESILDATCVYCDSDIGTDESVVYLMSEEKSDLDPDADAVRLYFVELHIRCSENLKVSLDIFSNEYESISATTSLAPSSRITYTQIDGTDTRCVYCGRRLHSTQCVVFSDLDSESQVTPNVWCHTECSEHIAEILGQVTKYTEDILATDI